MKKIVIVPACTDLNRGDQALVWEAANILRDAMGNDTQISVTDYGSTPEDRRRQSRQTRREGLRVVANIIQNPKRIVVGRPHRLHMDAKSTLLVALRGSLDLIKHFLLWIYPSRQMFRFLFRNDELLDGFEAIKEADVIAVKGGGFLHTYGNFGDWYYLWFGLYHVLLGLRLRKTVVVFPNSVGPIAGPASRWAVRQILRRVALLYVREQISWQYLKSIGISHAKYSCDLGYYALPSDVPTLGSLCVGGNLDPESGKSRKKLGITLRPYRFPTSNDPNMQYTNYVRVVRSFCERNPQYDFYFIIQVQGPGKHETDMLAVEHVTRGMSGVSYAIIDGDLNYKQLITVYGEMDFVIGTRFHSVIFSQLAGTPALAIAYGGNKTRGIMREMTLEDYVLDIENISVEELECKFARLQKDKDRYLDCLARKRLEFANSRRFVVEEVREACSRGTEHRNGAIARDESARN